jgi:hypothetical protein
MEMDVRVDKLTNATYYAAFNFNIGNATTNNGHGYFGIQSVGGYEEPRKHFHATIWDPTDVVGKQATATNLGAGVWCNHTPTEGAGMVCYWPVDWKEGRTYRLTVDAQANGSSMLYTMYVYDYSTAVNQRIATFIFPSKNKWIKEIASFLEDFGYHPSCTAGYRSYYLGNGYKVLTDNRRIELISANAVYLGTEQGTCNNANAAVQGTFFKLESGAGVTPKTPSGTILSRATPQIKTIMFNFPTELNGTTIVRNWARINASIKNQPFNTVNLYWNGKNYNFYDGSLILAYNFNKNALVGETTTKAIDNSKYGNNGTLVNGTAWSTAGKFGGAVYFDGVNDYIKVLSSNSLNVKNRITIEAWINPAALPIESSIVSKGGSLSCGNYDLYIYNGKLALLSTASCNWAYAAKNASITANTWQHIAAVYDGSRLRYYVNGVQKDNIYWPGLGATNTGTLEIGKQQSYAAGNYRGYIDELRIYNKSFTSDEILMHYQTELAKYNISEWRLYTTVPNLRTGTYTYYAWVNDATGAVKQSETRTVKVAV